MLDSGYWMLDTG